MAKDREEEFAPGSCSLCGHRSFRSCACPWDRGFAEVPDYTLAYETPSGMRYQKFKGSPGWPEEYLQFIRVIAPCNGQRGWKK